MEDNLDETLQFQFGGEKKLTDWANEPSLQVLKGDLEAAKPSHDTQLSRIQKWVDLLKIEGKAKPPQVKNRSRVQPKVVRRQAEWRYSALSEPFLSSDKLFTVSPVTFEDEPAARQNELVLNYQFRTKIDRVKFVDDIVRAMVNEGTALARTGWCRYAKKVKKTVPVFDHFTDIRPEELQALQQAIQLKQADPNTYNHSVDPALQAAVDYLEQTGIPTRAEQSGEEEIEEERLIKNHPTVEILNPANVYVDPTCNGNLDDAYFVIYSFETSKADLLKEGDRYQNLDQVNWEGNSPLTSPDHESQTLDTSFNFRDGRKKAVAYEYWGFYDTEGTGELYPIVATWIGDTMIRMEKNPFPDEKLPFVAIPYLPVLRELYGEPDAELLEDPQKIIGAVMRGMIDSMGRSANAQQGFAKGMLDAVNRRRYENGEDYEFNPNLPPNVGLIEHKYPELPQSALAMVQVMNQDAEALTGVKSFSGGLSGEAYGKVATGIRGMLDAATKREMAILRRLAKGISEIGRKILAMNGEFLSDTEVIRITNSEFISVNREDLQGEFDLQVDISTFEVDNEKAQDLGFILQTLGPNADPSVYMKVLAEICELKRMPALAQQLRNWRPPPPDPIQQQLAQLEVQAKQMEIQKLQSEIALNQAKAHQAEATGDLKDLDRVEQETGTKHARDIDRIQSQSRGNQDLKVTESLLKPKKEGERDGDIEAAVGYGAYSEAKAKDELLR